MKMKQKQHRFMVVVKGTTNRAFAEMRILCALALRNPDGCEIIVHRKPPTNHRNKGE